MSYLLFDLVSNELVKVSSFTASEIYEKLEQPPDSKMGDVAFPCFSLSRTLKRSPQMIAEDLRTRLLEQPTSFIFSEIQVIGAYLNFFLNRAEVLKLFYHKIKSNSLVMSANSKGKKVTIEHTSVNPNASPHIGRARNAMIGDASVRLLRYLGCDVKVRYFVNDIGKQIALLSYYTKDKVGIEFNELLNLYVSANEELKTNPEIEKEVFDILHCMENGDKEVFATLSRIVDICIKGQMKIFNEFGIYYDVYDYESQYILSGKTKEVLSLLKNTGKLFEDQEKRLVLNLDEFRINSENPYLPLTRKDKTSLYPLRDICYNMDKAIENQDRNIVVLGEDQKLYGKQINAVLNLLGIEETEVINYAFVLLPDGKMSTRAGQVVLLEDLMYTTVEYAKSTISKHRHTDSDKEFLNDDILSKQLAYGSIKYSILKCSNEKNVMFDRESALNFQGDTSVYIQYSYARIQSLLKEEHLNINEDALITLKHPFEWEIIKKTLFFNQVLHMVSQDFNFSTHCSYLFDLCQCFSRWYKECPIKNTDATLKSARLFLASVVGSIIKDGLNILGIDAPDKI